MQIDRSNFTCALAVLATLCGGTLAAQVPQGRPAQGAGNAALSVGLEKDLDGSGPVTLVAGERFRISVPLHPSIAVNLGAGQLDITLARKVKTKQEEQDLHLIAVLGSAQASLKAGDKSVILHGVAPSFGTDRNGEYHPSDYSIHFGSGNITNIGTPDESFIDTEALTNKLEPAYSSQGRFRQITQALLAPQLSSLRV